jgi:sugar phosphate isomerase/epimerase
MVRTAINLYSVRELDEPLPRILDRVADADYDGVQFSGGFADRDPAAIADALDERDLAAAPPHVGIEELEDDPAASAAAVGALGTDGAVLPYLGEDHFDSRAAATETAERLNALAAVLGDDIRLHYHNHAHEFVDLGDTTGFETFADASQVGLEVDVGWVHTSGHDPVALIEHYRDRIDLVHMKDMANGEFREIGEGDVDMQACADAARAAGASWLVYEHDQPEDPVASIDAGAAFLKEL